MAPRRRAVPVHVAKQVHHEAGYKCGNPVCRTIITLDVHHLLARRRAHVPGTKTDARDRDEVDIAEWATPYLEAHCRAVTANAPLFPGVTRYEAYKAHIRACGAVGIEDYTIHDARHSWAVRAKRAGATSEVVARQLGHRSTAQVEQVYGRFVPTEEERRGWERIAALQDVGATRFATSRDVAIA